MRFISLFSGIGGLDLGLERAGWRCVAQVENDDYALAVLQRHWPGVPKWRDVRDVQPEELPEADAVVGGFPCQPFSVAGKRRGADDPRNLWPEMRRIVAGVRPRWVLAENTPGIISVYLDGIADDLEALGYTVGAFTLPAAAFGAPHIRERLFVVAHADGVGLSLPADIEWVCPSEGVAVTAPEPFLLGPWPPGPEQIGDVPRMDDGVPHRVDRLRALGNAVVPQVAEFIGRLIIAVDRIWTSMTDYSTTTT